MSIYKSYLLCCHAIANLHQNAIPTRSRRVKRWSAKHIYNRIEMHCFNGQRQSQFYARTMFFSLCVSALNHRYTAKVKCSVKLQKQKQTLVIGG